MGVGGCRKRNQTIDRFVLLPSCSRSPNTQTDLSRARAWLLCLVPLGQRLVAVEPRRVICVYRPILSVNPTTGFRSVDGRRSLLVGLNDIVSTLLSLAAFHCWLKISPRTISSTFAASGPLLLNTPPSEFEDGFQPTLLPLGLLRLVIRSLVTLTVP